MNAKRLICLFKNVSFLCLAVAGLTMNFSAGGATLVELSLNEGEGTNVTDSASSWEGYLHITDAANAATDEPFLEDESPSGDTGDRSVLIRGNGYLAARDTNAVLAFGPGEPFTVEAWVFLDLFADPEFLNAEEGIISYGGAYSLGLKSSRLVFTLFDVAEIEPPATQPVLVPADTWHHVAAAYEPGVGVTLYLDGVATFVENTNRVAHYFNNVLFLGAERGDNNILANLDRLRIHSGLLTPAQLDSVAGTPKPVYANTLAAYNFDGGQLPAPNLAPAVMPAVPSIEFVEAAPWITDDPAAGAADTAVAFDGLWKVTLPAPEEGDPVIPSDVTNFTVEAYVKLPATLPPSRMVLLDYRGEPGFAVGINPDRTLHATIYGTREISSSAQIPAGTAWHHIAVVHEDAMEVRFYVDGELLDSVAYTQGPGSSTNSTLVAGMDHEGLFRFDGSLDRIRISDAALDPSEFDLLDGPPVDGPTLAISRTASEVTVSWPVAAGDFVLETTTALGPGASWSTLTHETEGGQNTYTTEATGATRFFRLLGN